jgi:transglutaminase-like putative cysteine protease
MAALKLLETRKRRDQIVLLFIAIFLIMAALLREQHLWSLPYMMVSLVVTLAAWLRMSAVPNQPRATSFANAMRFIAYAVPLAIAMWIFFPRISTPFWSVPIDTSAGMTGLSDTMSPGDITSLSESQAVAFRVRFDGEAPAPRDRYWRAIVLHRFNGRTWTGWDPTPDYAFRERTEFFGDPLAYQVTLEPTRTQWLVALDVVDSWDLPQSAVSRNHNLWRFRPVDQRLVYQARSYVDFRIDVNLPEQAQRWYLDLPDDSNPRARRFAERLRRETGSDEAFLRAVLERFYEDEYYYTLKPPRLGANPVDRFLFDTQRGFCEHFASAFAVLARAAGIPSRIVLGYQGGETNPMGDYMIVRQADAHAWTEVWLEGQGWQRIDPTAAVAPERIEAGRSAAMFGAAAEAWGLSAPSRFAHQLGLTWDALNTRWNDFILGYGPEKQDRFMRWMGLTDPGWRNLLLTLIGAVIALTLIVHVLLMLHFRPPREDRARRLYEQFVRKTRIAPAIGESPLAFAERVSETTSADAVHSITTLYLEARYGDGGDPALEALSRAVRRFRSQPA